MFSVPIGTALKMRRAYEQCDALQKAIQGCLKNQGNPLATEFDPNTGDYIMGIEFKEPPPLDLAVVVGDALFNYRSALDHLAYGLAERKHNPPPTGTEFPIFEDRDAFFRKDRRSGDFARGSGKYKIRGLADEAQAIIEDFQPFNGSEDPHVLLALHDLNRIDKHRLLHFPHFMLAEAEARPRRIHGTVRLISQAESGPIDLKAEVFRYRPVFDSAGRFAVDMQRSKVEIDIAFDRTGPGRGAAVMEFFNVLYGHLSEMVLPAFRRFFA